jgi:S-adenosylmethionine:tRNA ribosyltransferase-isomerase
MLFYLREKEEIKDSHFFDLGKYLNKGDVLVFNDSKVIPARLRAESNGKEFEVLLVKKIDDGRWESWVRPGRKAKIGEEFIFSKKLNGVLEKRENEIFYFKFNLEGQELFEEIERIGEMPIPPYILKARGEGAAETVDKRDYQTIFAKETGSVAAPTASLHFSEKLMAELAEKEIQTEKVTLHVSLGTFQPVNTENVEDFKIHSEYFEILPQVAERLNKAKKEGRRIIAVGTTAVRVLESAAVKVDACGLTGRGQEYLLLPKSGETKIYIYPGYDFKFIDGMITNFHLPKSSLLLLVSAFIGKEQMERIYQHAVEENYKFYSYGDGMLLL